MTGPVDRRAFVAGSAMAAAGALLPGAALAAVRDPVAPYRTPYKYGKLVLGGSQQSGAFDEKFADCPFVFSNGDKFYLTYVGFDGKGYQTGIAESDDLVNWTRKGIMLARDPADPVTQFNVASASILRENELYSPGRLVQVDGRYLCAWHAYPDAGYEIGAAVIGLAWSDDLVHWHRDKPILFPQDGADWERGGLYKPYIVRDGGIYYLFYNAKTTGTPWFEQTGVATSTDLKSWTRFSGNPIIRNGDPATSQDSRFASDPAVYKHGKDWALYYFGRARDGKCRELLALGKDPMHFAKVNEVLIDKGAPGTVDDAFAHKPSMIWHKGDLYHFYCAVSGKWPNDVRGISVARSRPW